jgi:hypothetical protein
MLPDGVGRGAPTAAGIFTELIACLERNLQGKLALAFTDEPAHEYLANIGFILSCVADAGGDVASLLGDAWAAQRRERLAWHVASYRESCWGPAVALLETPVRGRAKPAKKTCGVRRRVYQSAR